MVKTFKISSRTEKPMTLKLGLRFVDLKLYKVYLNDDPGLTLTNFTARSNLVAYAIAWEKTVTKSFNGNSLQQMTKLTE